MRVPRSAALFALLLPLSVEHAFRVPAAHAQETVHYKSRPKEPPRPPERPPIAQPPAQKPPVYKPPVNPPPAERPPDREHPVKRPPDPRPPDPPSQPRPPQPPPPHGWPSEPPCPPPSYEPPTCPPPLFDISPIEEPPPGNAVIPVASDLNSILSRRLRLMQIEGFAGQVAVGWDGQVRFERSLGAGRIYDIGPVTEAFTAWAVYKLVDSKKLSLATPLGELFPGAPEDKRGITIEQLLGQTSGLGNTFAADGEIDRDTAVGKLLAQPLAHAPGEMFTPSDDGYVILAAAIEVASGIPYESYLWQSGVVSGDMTSTVFWGGLGSGVRDANWGKRGAGGILSTASDLFRWASRFLDRPDYAMNEIIRPRQWTEDGVGIGYGWFMDDSDAPILWTNGTGDLDHNVIVVVYPTSVILVVASDRFHGDVPWSERVANALEPVLREWEPPSTQPHWTLWSRGVENSPLADRH